jgi:hypothetical protein
VDRLSASFPGQELRAETAAQWFEELRPFPAVDVWLAVRRVRREQANMPRSVAVFLNAIDANDREDRERRRVTAQLALAPGRRRRGAPMPPEAKRAVEVFTDRLDGKLEPDHAAKLINELADQLDQRVAAASRRDPDPSEATRTCAECATSQVVGQVDHVLAVGDADNPYDHPVAVVVPCPGCRPVRAQVLDEGGMPAMSLRTDRDGWPEAWAGRPHARKEARHAP